MSQPMFSESWHRIASHRAWLHPSVEVQRQTFRGRPWHVLRDPFSNQFFRLPPAAYQFIARLNPGKTIEQVWRECLHFRADEAPGQEEVIRLLSQLTQANLIVSDLPPDTAALFERSRRNKEKELHGQIINFLFMKFRLFDPDRLLCAALPFFRPFLSRAGAVAWLLVILLAIAVAVQNWDAIFLQGQGLLAPENLFLLYVCGVLVKLWHEFGHGLLCRRFGGEVRTFGVMLMVLTPLPYVDASSSWSFRHRWQRMLVASGGMIFELFVAALAVFIWASTGRGMVNSLAYNVMVLSSVTTLAFNANPLLRFDGYYIFSDLIEIPNLNHRAIQQLRYLLERYGYGCIHSVSPSQTQSEAWWLATYGLSSGIYRVFLIGVILLVVAQHFFALGMLIAGICFVLWILGPIFKFCRYLWTDSALERQRWPAIQRTAAVVGVVLAFLVLVPLPHHFQAEGIVQAKQFSRIYAGYAGQIDRVLVPSGTMVKAGTPLILMKNPELDLEISSAQSKLRATLARMNVDDSGEARIVTQGSSGEVRAIRELLAAQQKNLSMLTLTAPHDGIWVCPQDSEMPGGWLDRGTEVGELIDPTQFNFIAVVPQQFADTLFSEMRGAEVRLHGQAGHVLRGLSETVIPGKQEILPSAALGWKGGGPVEVAADDTEGLHTTTPFFEVQVLLPAQPANVVLTQRATGVARFDLPAESLFFQWVRSLRQLLLSRLQV